MSVIGHPGACGACACAVLLALGYLSAPAQDQNTSVETENREPINSISGNAGANNISTGTGWLGRTLGIPTNSGVTREK